MPIPTYTPGDPDSRHVPGPGAAYANITTPGAWATALLQQMNLPVTTSNVNFLVSWAAAEGGNWHNTARYNPLNTTQAEPGYSKTGTQGNIGSYTSWLQGLQATATTLNNGYYPQIMGALRSGDASAYNANGSLSANLSTWGTGRVSPNTAYAGLYAADPSATLTGPNAPAGGGAAPTAGSASASSAPASLPPGVGLNNIPALDQYIRTNYPTFSWLLDISEVKGVLEKAIAGPRGPDTSDQIQGLLAQTTWWKTTSTALKTFENMRVTTPEELNFGDQGSKAAQMYQHVITLGAPLGLNWGQAAMQGIAMEALTYGWSDPQIQARLGSFARVVSGGGGGVGSNDPQLLATLKADAGEYLVNPNQAQLNTYMKAIATGSMSEGGWKSYLAGLAAQKYPSMAAQIQGGMTPNQIIAPLRTDVGQLMEVSPDSINFISDPMYTKILTYRPPDAGTTVQPVRAMTTSEAETYLRGTGQYSYTQGARNTASDLSKTMLETFGKVAGA